MFIDVENCPSCHQEHIELMADELAVALQLGKEEYDLHYICPKDGNSVYVKSEDYADVDQRESQ